MSSEQGSWSPTEETLARELFGRALRREVEALIVRLRLDAADLQDQDDIWRLHDFLSIQRHAIEGRSQFQLIGLLFVFADFLRQGLVEAEELEGLSADKQAKIKAMALMG